MLVTCLNEFSEDAMKFDLINLFLLSTYLIQIYRYVEKLKPLAWKDCALHPGIGIFKQTTFEAISK